GTRLAIEYVYDNSEDNPNNPMRPLQRVRFGQESADEMGTCTFSLTLKDVREQAKLWMATTDRDLEKLPNAWNLLMRKAQLERELGSHDVASKLSERACVISPGAPGGWIERGMIAESMRQQDRAVESYRRAISLDAKHAMAHLHLGTLFGRGGNNTLAL